GSAAPRDRRAPPLPGGAVRGILPMEILARLHHGPPELSHEEEHLYLRLLRSGLGPPTEPPFAWLHALLPCSPQFWQDLAAVVRELDARVHAFARLQERAPEMA